jgi:NO-binding membrane sensor protein with MHYT domain
MTSERADIFICAEENTLERLTFCPYKLGDNLPYTMHPGFVLLSVAYAIMGACVTVMVLKRLQRCRSKNYYWTFVLLGGISLGFCSIWTMHFTGMKAMKVGNYEFDLDVSYMGLDGQLVHKKVPALGLIEMKFEVFYTVLSLVAAIGVVSLGLWIISRKSEYANPSPKVDQRKIQAVAGIWAVAVCVMHYMGMYAQGGVFEMVWHAHIIMLSGVIALVVAYVGLRILFSERIVPNITNQAFSGITIGLAVCSMHYTGMLAATYEIKLSDFGVPAEREPFALTSAYASFGSAWQISIAASICKFFIALAIAAFDRQHDEAATSILEAEVTLRRSQKKRLTEKSEPFLNLKSPDDTISVDGEDRPDVHHLVQAYSEKKKKDGFSEPRFLYPAKSARKSNSELLGIEYVEEFSDVKPQQENQSGESSTVSETQDESDLHRIAIKS